MALVGSEFCWVWHRPNPSIKRNRPAPLTVMSFVFFPLSFIEMNFMVVNGLWTTCSWLAESVPSPSTQADTVGYLMGVILLPTHNTPLWEVPDLMTGHARLFLLWGRTCLDAGGCSVKCRCLAARVLVAKSVPLFFVKLEKCKVGLEWVTAQSEVQLCGLLSCLNSAVGALILMSVTIG